MSWLNGFFKFVVTIVNSIPISWVDLVIVAVLSAGIVRGRKRGLSEEILDLVKWILIVLAGALLYRQFGDFIYHRTWFSLLSFYLFAYLFIGLSIWIVFSIIKQRFGQKLIESDVFGRFEFYGGMAAGMTRYACALLVCLSLLHAPFYSDAEREARKREVEYNYGSDFFPTVCKLQDSVFVSSMTGRGATKYLGFILMEPVSADSPRLRDDSSLARRNERTIDAIMGGR